MQDTTPLVLHEYDSQGRFVLFLVFDDFIMHFLDFVHRQTVCLIRREKGVTATSCGWLTEDKIYIFKFASAQIGCLEQVWVSLLLLSLGCFTFMSCYSCVAVFCLRICCLSLISYYFYFYLTTAAASLMLKQEFVSHQVFQSFWRSYFCSCCC